MIYFFFNRVFSRGSPLLGGDYTGFFYCCGGGFKKNLISSFFANVGDFRLFFFLLGFHKFNFLFSLTKGGGFLGFYYVPAFFLKQAGGTFSPQKPPKRGGPIFCRFGRGEGGVLLGGGTRGF